MRQHAEQDISIADGHGHARMPHTRKIMRTMLIEHEERSSIQVSVDEVDDNRGHSLKELVRVGGGS